MILKSQQTIPLNPPMQKILCTSTAYHDTYLILRLDRSGQQQTLVHLNLDGSIAWELKYQCILGFFAMMNDRQAIILNVPSSKIDIIDLKTHKIIQLNHHFLYQDTAFMSIETFPDTNLFCIVQKGGVNEHRIRLTYYDYNQIAEKSWPVTQWESQEGQWNYDCITKKINNHSKIAWWLYSHQEYIQFLFFDLKQKIKGEFQSVKVRNTIGLSYGIGKAQLCIPNLWQSSPTQYTLVGLSSKNQHKNKCKDSNGIVNNNFIIDTSMGIDKGIIRQTRFIFENEKDGYSNNDHLIDCFGLGSFSVFHTFRNKEGQAMQSPIYYVSNQNQKIIAIESWKCSCYTSNFFVPGWDGSTLIQSEHKNADCEEVTITVKKVIDLRELSLHFLLHINDDFDDDLLKDAVDLIHDD